MYTHEYERFFKVDPKKLNNVWNKLQRRETFCKGQIPPYRVEFESGKDKGEFFTGEKNIHHGPLLSVHGEIGEINAHYRDLKYYYGSYILSFRLFKPQRLEFFKEVNGIRLKITTQVNKNFLWLWVGINNIFWKFFGISFLF